MTVTMIGPTGARVGSGVAGPGLRAVLRCIDCHYVSVRTGQRVRPPGVGGNYSHPGRPRDAMRDWMSRRTPTLIEATP
jgi:hypothetical protein